MVTLFKVNSISHLPRTFGAFNVPDNIHELFSSE
jgi:hypothetical protein